MLQSLNLSYGVNFVNKQNIIEGTTCFQEHAKRNLPCLKTSCRCWLESTDNFNCTVLASKEGTKTLQEIGDLFGVTRMRICQIEKSVMNKIREKIDQN